ncbi:MAG: amidohydrolase family protein [Gammaproteobacteria bacterium]|nr:amidohydrolase family protein [Gammaproteobacteria bacterium]
MKSILENKVWIVLIFISLNISSQPAYSKSESDLINQAYQSTYKPIASPRILIKNANILTGTGELIESSSILIENNKIVSLGNDDADDAEIIDAKGKWITPGIIDIHSHMGVYPAPSLRGNSDGNEATSPVTPHVWAEHSVWTQDPQFTLALKGGVTTFHVLPGSANLFGGRGVTLKNIRSVTVQGMKFPNAPYTLKMACGENPKRVYGNRESEPSTRMGNVAGYRDAWIDAQHYMEQMALNDASNLEDDSNDDQESFKRDLKMETLSGVLRGEILIQNHCYRGEEMAVMMDIAKEFNYKVTAFHHAIEAYKVADLLAENGVCAAMWADWWGFKNEAYDMVWENVAMVDQALNANGCAIVHSDSAVGIQHLNQEASKARSAGLRAGLNISKARAIRWITINPAKALGIADRVGSLEVGKMADLVIWDGDPFSTFTKAERVFIDGHLSFDATSDNSFIRTDFDLGIIEPGRDRL